MVILVEPVFSRSYIAQVPPGGESVYHPNVNAADPEGINPTVIMMLIAVAVLAALILFKRR